jgi:hypothetical protein
MSYRYRLRLRPQIGGYPRRRPQVMPFAETVAQSVEGAVIYEFGQDDLGDHALHVGLTRATHEQALDELFTRTQQFGYAWVSATISQWVDEAVSGAILGSLGAGAIGARANNELVLAGAALVGAFAGRAIGAQVGREEVVFHVQRAYPSGWILTAVTPNEGDTAVGRWRLA